MKTFTLEDVRREAHKLDPERENPSYEDDNAPEGVSQCRYVEPDGSPSCIAANIFVALEPALPPLLKEHNEGCAVFDFCDIAAERGVARFDDEAQNYLRRAQDRADVGYSWGQAIEAAEAAEVE